MNIIKKFYIDVATKTILRMDPTLNKEDVEEAINHIVKARLKDPTVTMDNNVTGDNARITLTKLCSWIDRENPVISGNATFYCQPEKLQSPTSNMLRSLKKGRKEVKKKMFAFKPGSDEYQALDLDQGNKKVIMNAEYGGSGAPTAAFYTKYSPAATTLMAQSIITTMAAFFEGYVGDNQKYFSVDECFDWMNKVVLKDEPIPRWVVRPTAEQVSYRIKKHFYLADASSFPAIDDYIRNCSSDELVYLYYANNVKDFIKNHDLIKNLIRSVLSNLPNYEAAVGEVPVQFQSRFSNLDDDKDPVEEYNRWISDVMFLNPYKIPETIKKYMEEFITLMTQFIFVEYLTPDSIVKLNNHMRNTVLLVDTDSNIINVDLFVSFILKEIFPGESFGRKKLYNEMILVNVLAATLDRGVANILDYYGRMHNMNKEARAELTMKNEFMFRRFFLMNVKKRYAASIVLREGNIIIPFKPEIKGVDFIKAGVTDEVSNRFKKMLCDHILYSEDLELHQMMTELKSFEKEIYNDLRSGGVRYLKQQQYKAEEGYSKIKDSDGRTIGSKAWSLPVFRGSAVWNELYPDKKINSLDRVCILKTVVTGLTDLEKIKSKYPEDYSAIVQKIFMSPRADIQKAGLKYLCIPNNVKKIPDWAIPLIDYDLIISDVVSSFRSILEALKIEDVSFKTPNGNASITSCLISI